MKHPNKEGRIARVVPGEVENWKKNGWECCEVAPAPEPEGDQLKDAGFDFSALDNETLREAAAAANIEITADMTKDRLVALLQESGYTPPEVPAT